VSALIWFFEQNLATGVPAESFAGALFTPSFLFGFGLLCGLAYAELCL